MNDADRAEFEEMGMIVFPLESVTLATPEAELHWSLCLWCDARLDAVRSTGKCGAGNGGQCQWSRHFRNLRRYATNPTEKP